MKTLLTIFFAGCAIITSAQQQPPLIHNVWDTNNASMTDMKGTGLTNGGTAYLDDLYRNGVRVATTNELATSVESATNHLLVTANENILTATNCILRSATNSFYGNGNPSNFVTSSITNGLATTNYVKTLTSSNTAAITNFGKATAVALTNGANAFTGAFTGNASGLSNIPAVFNAYMNNSAKSPQTYMKITNAGVQYWIILYQ